MERHITVEGGVNIRDLGGYPTLDGQVTRHGRLIRSANLDKITPAGQQTLLSYGLRTVIDLRHDNEVRDYPDVFAGSTSVRYLHLPFSREEYAGGDSYARLDEYYVRSLAAHGSNICAIIGAIADSEPGILYHCAVGKDRTGLISALVLGAVGVPAEVIAEDYAETTRHIAHLIEQWRENGRQRGDDMTYFDRDVAADAPIMLATLATLENEYGGVENYLRMCGVSDAQITRLKALLVD